jgi:hypothetical protein
MWQATEFDIGWNEPVGLRKIFDLQFLGATRMLSKRSEERSIGEDSIGSIGF